jgi:hypothetical protein
MILLDVLPSRTYYVSYFTELGLSPNIIFNSPSVERMRRMSGQGFSVPSARPD